VRGDELSRRKMAARLIAARAYPPFAAYRRQLSDDVVIPIEDANLAIEIGGKPSNRPACEVTRHSQMGFVLDGADVCAGQREG